MKIYTAEQLAESGSAPRVEEIVRLLADSFTKDPTHEWLFTKKTTEASFKSALFAYFRFVVRFSILCHAMFWVADGEESEPTIRTIAIVIPPQGNAAYDATMTGIRAGYLRSLLKCGFTYNWRMMIRFRPGLERMHNEMFPDRTTKYHNWHLFYLATNSKYRGQGLGRQFLSELQNYVRTSNEELLQQAKANGKKFMPAPIYLEASSPDNKRLYNSVGFQDRTSFAFGEISDDENVRRDSTNKVLGSRQFGMIWSSH